ncbi:CHAD domain-containing protein [Algoriphagus sp.]|uniref:CHAD domain-containing protein n=1 Tax=Algoriphagus sp. TaxID=1872435 RepID=UPI0025F04BD3|nr:CHAD domain-containing protein [Algoriphagus sp.]
MKTLKKNLKSNLDTIDELLKTPRGEFSKSTFHKLRVEIKKLNAIFNLINFCTKDFKRKETFRPFKEVFKQAGKVRELQLEEDILDQYFSTNSLFDYRKRINNDLSKEKNSFFELLGKELDRKIAHKMDVLIPFVDQVGKKKAEAFIEKKKNVIESLISKNSLNTEELHKLRKLLKTLMYSLASISLENEENIDSEELELTDLLGDWHDFDIAINKFDKALISNEIEPNEAKEIEEVKIKISLERDLLLKKIEQSIPLSKFYHKTGFGNS